MAKKGSILLIIAILMTFTSCGLDYRYALDEDLHNKIECVWGEDDPSHIIYQGKRYIYVGTTGTFMVKSTTYEHYEDVLLSWNGNRYFGYIDTYYSDTADNPVFIYNARNPYVFLREDYDYLTDTFVIDDTDEEIVVEDIFDSKRVVPEFKRYFNVRICSKKYPRIKIDMGLVYINDQWYIVFQPIFSGDSREGWSPSDEFIKILLENELIHT